VIAAFQFVEAIPEFGDFAILGFQGVYFLDRIGHSRSSSVPGLQQGSMRSRRCSWASNRALSFAKPSCISAKPLRISRRKLSFISARRPIRSLSATFLYPTEGAGALPLPNSPIDSSLISGGAEVNSHASVFSETIVVPTLM
jgi:hypothetical protein